MNIHFISGLPRSGSTLLAALLRQNPKLFASMSTPVGGIFSAMQKAISGSNEASMFISDAQRKRLLMGVFKEYYALHKESVIFDTNRIWTSKLPVLADLFPDSKMVCCVRHPHSIVNSIEVLLQKNPLQLSGIFGFEPGGNVHTRCSGLVSSGGLVGFAMEALQEGCYGPHKDRLLLVEYQALAVHPLDSLKAIYDWLGLPWWEYHDFDNVEQIPGVDEFDRKLGTPGLHTLRSKVEWSPTVSVLPPDLAPQIPSPFWQSSGFNVPVLRCAPTTEAKVQNGNAP